MHEHEHVHRFDTAERLILAILINISISIAQIIAGLVTNSLALISDAGHNLSDVFALILSYFGVQQEKRKATVEKSYGFHRAEVVVAFFNAVILIGISIFIFYRAYLRFLHPEPIVISLTLAAAIFGIMANLAGVFVLYTKETKKSLNIRTALLHLTFDAFTSGGVVLSTVLIWLTGNPVFDPIMSVIIGVVILWGGLNVFLETVHILLEGTPKNIRPEMVEQSLAQFPEVQRVHDLHIWSLSSIFRILTVHLVIDDQKLSESVPFKEKIKRVLRDRYHIQHVTIQLEAVECGDDEMICKRPHYGKKGH